LRHPAARTGGDLRLDGRDLISYDNAAAQSLFARSSASSCTGTGFPTRAAGRTAIFEIIEVFYNRRRIPRASAI
jgi:hypothetical protein